MRRARITSSALVTAGISFVLVAASTFATTAIASADPAPPPTTAATSGTPASAQITLITGDQVQISTHDGHQAITTKAADRGPGTAPVSFSTFTVRGDTYVAPSDAAVYIGAPLDWSLFDVSALARAGVTNGAQMPITVDYAPGTQHAALPGLADTGTATSTRHTMRQAPANAANFGAALATQLQRDAARAHGTPSPATAGGLFSGIRSITLDSAKAAAKDPTVRGNPKPDPGFNMQTLTLNAIDRDGVPPPDAFAGDNGYYIVDDVDDMAGFAAEIPMDGSQNWSVPAGNYDIRAFIFTWFQKTITILSNTGSYVDTVWDYNMSYVWHPQVSIQHDTIVTSDARTAKEVPIPTTPDRDTTSGWRVDLHCCVPEFELVSDRVSRTGDDLPFYWDSGAHDLDGDVVGLSMYVAPSTNTVTDGSEHFYTYQRLESPSTGHTYDLQYPTAGGAPSSFATRVRTADLASVPTTYASEVPGRIGLQARFGYEPWETLNERNANQITEPLVRTEYVLATGAAAHVNWQESASMSDTALYPFADDYFGPYAHYRVGAQPAVRWFDGPRRPGAEEPGASLQPGDVADGAMICPVCRNTNTLSFNLKPYVDGSSDEWAGALATGNALQGTLITDDESLDWYVNGALTAQSTTDTNAELGQAPLALPAVSGAANYSLQYTVDRDAFWSSLSTETATRWDFASTGPHRSDPLPAGWSCGTLGGKCGVVPLLLLDYQVPLDKHEAVTAPGTVSFTVHVYHQPDSTSKATINVPTVSTSIDDGASWTQASNVRALGNGYFRVTMTTPDPQSVTGFVSLKVGDNDSTGDDVAQKIIRAFTLAGSAASKGAGVGDTPPPPSGGGGGVVWGAKPVCPTAASGQATCDAIVRTTSDGRPAVTPAAANAVPAGYGAADLASAYDLPRTGGANQTVAVVDAAGDPNIAADVARYRAQYGLPACTVDTGCLRVVNEDGSGPPSTSPRSNNQNWGMETALDMDMVSAACPDCRLLLVVADVPSFDDLATAEQTAANLGANVISNSFGSYELAGVDNYAAAFRHPGVAVVASSGDQGFGINGSMGGTQFPASLPSVTAVGGTRLVPQTGTSRKWSETAWTGGGSGCSAYFAKPAWQPGANCHMRTVADVSAVADPNTGVAVYDSYLNVGAGWLVVGGTSVAAPLIAGMYGLAGNAATASTPQHIYQSKGSLNDITSGSNGHCGSTRNYLCNAGKGYDAPTGMGSPRGVGAF